MEDTLVGRLQALGTRGVLVQMAQRGQIIERRCESPIGPISMAAGPRGKRRNESRRDAENPDTHCVVNPGRTKAVLASRGQRRGGALTVVAVCHRGIYFWCGSRQAVRAWDHGLSANDGHGASRRSRWGRTQGTRSRLRGIGLIPASRRRNFILNLLSTRPDIREKKVLPNASGVVVARFSFNSSKR
jgi:hypothetical protein